MILALVVTELLTNAVKHAYGGQPGSIRVTVEEQGPKAIRIAVEDHGTWAGSGKWSEGVGSRLVRALLAPLKSKIGFENNRPGLRVVLEVPLRTGSA